MKISNQVILTLFFSFFAIFIYSGIVFKRNPVLQIGTFRRALFNSVVINAICFASVALYFNYTYGHIVDDLNYFIGALSYTKGFFDIGSGSEFMYYISRPFRLYLFLDRPSFHILFGTMGFIGSLNFLFILTKTADFFDKKSRNENILKLFSILCFPNIMLWGRFYGKDTATFFLGSVYCIGAFYLITGSKHIWRNGFLALIPILLLYKLRPHIAAVFAISLLIGMYLKSINKRKLKTPNMEILYKILIPVVIAIVLSFATVYSLRALTNKETVSVENVQQTLISATQTGASGGSATDVAGEIRNNPQVIFSPRQIIVNVVMILVAPMPWKVRGAADALAFLSNILLLLLVIKFVKNIDLTDVFQKYLIFLCCLLIFLLSFMTGNVGLILRQKTILLPFIFLLLFSTKMKHANKSPANRNNLSKPRFNT